MRPFPDPSILLHPQIPKPLHLMAPEVACHGDVYVAFLESYERIEEIRKEVR